MTARPESKLDDGIELGVRKQSMMRSRSSLSLLEERRQQLKQRIERQGSVNARQGDEDDTGAGSRATTRPISNSTSRDTLEDRRRKLKERKERRDQANEKGVEADEEGHRTTNKSLTLNPFVGITLSHDTFEKKTLAREQQHLSAEIFVGATLATTITACYVSFLVLCVGDQQCLPSEDPAVIDESYATYVVVPALVLCLTVVSVALAAATEAASGISRNSQLNPVARARCRRVVLYGLFISLIFSLFFLALAIERGAHRLRRAHFRRDTRKKWRRCEKAASTSGVWRKHNGCDYPNSVRVFYKKHENLAERTLQNLKHVIYVSVSLALNFFFAVIACSNVLLSDPERPHENTCGDCFGSLLVAQRQQESQADEQKLSEEP